MGYAYTISLRSRTAMFCRIATANRNPTSALGRKRTFWRRSFSLILTSAYDPKRTSDPEGVRFSPSGIMTEACNSDL